jgi:hypothetical protein
VLLEAHFEIRRRDGTVSRLDRSFEHHDRAATAAWVADVDGMLEQASRSVARGLEPERPGGRRIHLAETEEAR